MGAQLPSGLDCHALEVIICGVATGTPVTQCDVREGISFKSQATTVQTAASYNCMGGSCYEKEKSNSTDGYKRPFLLLFDANS